MSYKFRLADLRQEHNISQRQLSDALGLSLSGIQHYENARRKPAYDILIALADYFDVSLDYLVGRTDNPDSHKM